MNPVVNDARALLEMLVASSWRVLHVRTSAAEIFIARTGGAPNPMREPGRTAHTASSREAEPSNRVEIRAPHVATIASVVAEAVVVGSGDVIASLDLLGERVEIVSPHAGIVAAVLVREGDFVEYDTILVSLVIQLPLPAS